MSIIATILSVIIFAVYTAADKKKKDKYKAIQESNESLTRLLTDSRFNNDEYIPHEWLGSSIEDIEVSVFGRRVAVETVVCNVCRCESKRIVKGSHNLHKEDSMSIQGHFVAGVKVADSGCVRKCKEINPFEKCSQ